MIKIEKEDSIVDILKKINKEKSNDIILDFPFWHPVLHNHLSLKIIQTKTRNKKLSIISNDKTAKKISKLLWIKFIKTKNNNKDKDVKNTEFILKKNYSFIEYAKYEINNFFWKISNLIKKNIKNNKKINTIFYLKNKYWNSNRNTIWYFILILTFIFILLLYIYYIAINKTSITIYPETILKNRFINFNFIEDSKNSNNNSINNQIWIERINQKINKTQTIWTSWIRQKKENLSKWKVTFYNHLKEKVYLLKNTTLENQKWVQFYLPKGISIPSWEEKNWRIIPWKIEIEIHWKIKLLNWDYSWLKTNIWKNVLLTIPRLKENKTKIFAKSVTKFKWWSNEFIKYLTQKDIENAKKLLKNILKEAAINRIEEDIEKKNKNNNIQMDLLPIDNIFKFNNLSINLPEHIKVWDEIDNFKISWKIEITSFIYNKQEVISLLKNSINQRLIKDYYRIISINDKSLRISHILKRNDLKKINWKFKYTQNLKIPLVIKATTGIEYIINKKFDDKDSNFIKKITHSILWKNIKEAQKNLTNRSEINNVKIKVQPFFIKTVSTIPENIEIIIKN